MGGGGGGWERGGIVGRWVGGEIGMIWLSGWGEAGDASKGEFLLHNPFGNISPCKF